MDTSGFYRLAETLQYAENFVYSTNFELRRDSHNEYEYPVFEWYWFDSEEEARTFFGIPTKPINIDIE